MIVQRVIPSFGTGMEALIPTALSTNRKLYKAGFIGFGAIVSSRTPRHFSNSLC